MKPCPLNPAARVEAGQALDRAEDGLVVGRHVVEARDEDRERDVRQPRQQVVRHFADVAEPLRPAGLEVARGREVAGEDAAVRELLCCEVSFRCDDERFEDAVGNRLAVEQVACFALDRERDTRRRYERSRIATRGDH